MNSLKSNYESVQERIFEACVRGDREPDEVKIVAVTKRFPASIVEEAYALGIRDVGENYAQELQQKRAEIKHDDLNWHFVGKLQRNKVKQVVGHASLLHAVDSERLLKTLEHQAKQQGVIQPILIAINIAGEDQKSGIDALELPNVLESIADSNNIDCQGLMTMAPYPKNPDDNRDTYKILKNLRDACKSALMPMPHLSMGTSGDFEVAIEEGATLVRLGTVLFGERPN